MPFHDRQEAAQQLSQRLQTYRGHNPLVLAIPRGAVPMGRTIADALDGELDVVLVHKLGAPGNPEYAIGSIDERGQVFLSEGAPAVDQGYLEREQQAQLEILRQRRQQYTPVRSPIDPAGRIVIVVDDGIATGSTMEAALCGVRAKQPAKLIAAVGVASQDSLRRIQAQADEVICLEVPSVFFAVGAFFQDFRQVSDEEVVEHLSR